MAEWSKAADLRSVGQKELQSILSIFFFNYHCLNTMSTDSQYDDDPYMEYLNSPVASGKKAETKELNTQIFERNFKKDTPADLQAQISKLLISKVSFAEKRHSELAHSNDQPVGQLIKRKNK
ncbi:hypothetical protein QEN19_000802 [Hanseniaspora menglaensis]